MTSGIPRSVGLGLAAIFAVLVGSAVACYWNTRQLHQDAGWVFHTQDVLDGLDELQTAITDAETGQRGFLLTGEARYLEPFHRAVATLPAKAERIQHLTADNPNQHDRIPSLRRATAAKMAELQRTIDLAQAGNTPGALAVVNTDEGQKLMAEIRTLLDDMRQEERALLAIRQPANERAYVIAAVTGPAAALLGAVVVGAYFWLLRRHLRERDRSAALLHEQKELLHATLVSIGDGVIVTDAAGRVILLNGVAQRLTGWSQEQAKGFALLDVFHIVNETTRQDVENPALRSLKEGVIVGLANHTILIGRDGMERPIDDSAAPVLTGDGAMAGAVLVFRDITDRKRAERQLNELLALESERSRRLRRVAAASLTLNSAHSTTSVLEVIRAEAREIIGAERSEVRVDGAPGTVRDVGLSAPLLGRNGQTIGHIVLAGKPLGTFTDDDEALLVQLAHMAAVAIENARLYDELRRANGQKDEFLATLAHELRNPLAPIGNALQVLRFADGDSGAAKKARQMMERQLKQLVRLVDDLLDVSRISRGRIDLKRERIDLASILHQAAEVCRPLAECSGHQIIVSLGDAPLQLDADPLRLSQVFNNLLTNAYKYSEPGGVIQVVAGREGDSAVVRVTDKGIGIPTEMLSRIFEMFAQVDQSLERAQGGLGIGLTLAKRLVELHEGTIEARSDGPGRGSEFIVRLPVAPPSPPATTDRAVGEQIEDATQPLRVLVVDDNVDSAESLAMLLKLKGHDVAVAHDGHSALKSVEQFRPQLVILDIGLPGMNGYEVARRIREELRIGDVTLAALTGWGQDEDRRRSKEAGFDEHLVKPVAAPDLAQLLNRVIVLK